MKRITVYLLLATVILVSCNNQPKQEESHIVKYSTEKLNIKFGDQVFEEKFSAADLSGNDTVVLNANSNDFEFGIYTDLDTLERKIPIDTKFHVNLVKENFPPMVIVVINGLAYETLQFDKQNQNANLRFMYDEDANSPYLQKLRAEYPIDSLAALGKTELEKAKIIATWVHGLWEHHGWNEPEQRDALYILEEVKKGQRFRCVEYGIVTTACLNAIGMKSRTLSLRTKDVETRPSGAGHVVMEVFINELNKWVMVDPQYDMITISNGIPLNAVELQQAITNRENVEMLTSEEDAKVMYISWIYPYLYYFAFPFDNRENITQDDKLRIDGKTSLMLVSIGAKEPTVFQQKYPIDYCIYTNSLGDFYRKP